MLRLDPEHVQVGAWPPLVLPDTPDVRAVLQAVDGVRDADRVTQVAAQRSGLDVETVRATLADLRRSGAVVDTTDWPASVPVDEVHAAVLRGDHPASLARRRGFAVQVHAPGSARGLGRLVAVAGELGGLPVDTTVPGSEPELLVVASVGEPARDSIDSAAQSGMRVLPIVLAEGRAVVGPWVHRGRTPCLRCADAAEARWGGRPALPPADRGSDRPHGVGVGVLQAAAALVVGDALAAADGKRPVTVASRWVLGPRPGAATHRDVAFAPECSCHLFAPVS